MNIQTCDREYDGLPTYKFLEEFMRGIDKFIRHNINGDVINDLKSQNRNKTVIHRLKPGDLAHVTLFYEAKLGIWENNVLGIADQEPKMKPKYHKEGRIARYGNAWNDKGRQYYRKLVTEYTRLWTNRNFITALVKHWQGYKYKNHKKSNKKRKRTSETPDMENVPNEEDILMDKIPAFTFPELPPLNIPAVESRVPISEEM